MENEQKTKQRVKHPDRVTLSPEALTRLGTWLMELDGVMKGSRITKSDLVNFLILSHSAKLSERDVEQLANQHFDEVRFAVWAVQQLKEAKAQGRNVTLAEIVGAPKTIPKGGNHASNTKA